MTKQTTALALPDVSTAKLPATYQRAKTALATCERLDECKSWKDRAAALASYAKQADDKGLMNMAVRIQSRAIRRCGELLERFDARGAHRKKVASGLSSRRDAGDKAGMSERQVKTAVRVANIPDEEFEALVESAHPPTITRLAERGIAPTGAKVPEKFQAATHLLGILRELKRFAIEHDDADLVGDAIYKHEAVSIRDAVRVAGPWLERLLARLDKRYPC
jgi:hypothetical protein